MYRTCALMICSLVLVSACAGGPASQDNRSGQAQASAGTQSTPAARAADAAQPLGEFDPLTVADVDLYLKVMRAAADRVKALSGADRAALKTYADLTSGRAPAQVPSPDQMAAMERATDLLALDTVVAREMGVVTRYRSIASRVPKFGMPEMGGEGDDEPMTPEQRAALRQRVERFRQRRSHDAAMLEPRRQEIEALQKQVDLITHPESIPR